MKLLVRYADLSLGREGFLDTNGLSDLWERADFETSLSRTVCDPTVNDTVTASDSESLIKASQLLMTSSYRWDFLMLSIKMMSRLVDDQKVLCEEGSIRLRE